MSWHYRTAVLQLLLFGVSAVSAAVSSGIAEPDVPLRVGQHFESWTQQDSDAVVSSSALGAAHRGAKIAACVRSLLSLFFTQPIASSTKPSAWVTSSCPQRAKVLMCSGPDRSQPLGFLARLQKALLEGARPQARLEAPSEPWYSFDLPLQMSPGQLQQREPELRDTSGFWSMMDLGVSLPASQNAIASMLLSYQPQGVVMAVNAAVRHRWLRLPREERPLLLLVLRQLWRHGADGPGLVAAALSAGSLPPLGKDAGLEVEQVRAAFGPDTACLLVEVQQLVAIECTVRTAAPGPDATGSLSQGQVDLAMSLLTNQEAQQKSSEALILFLAHKASELRMASGLLGGAPPDQSLLISVAMASRVFVPLSNLMGLGRIKDEFDDSVFAILHPEERAKLRQLLSSDESEALARDAAQELGDFLGIRQPVLQSRLAGVTSLRISGRAKTAYSVWKKMNNKNLKFEEVMDRAGIRIILDARTSERAEELCFVVRDIAAELWSLSDDKLLQKDYVSNPKANGYQSLHLVAEKQGRPFEVQIRSEKMHKQAEYGTSGHWEYKAGGKALAVSQAALSAGAELFAGIDANGDGRISATELSAALQRVGVEAAHEEVQAMLDVFDVDSDGAVDFKDFWKALVTTWFPLVSGTHRPRRPVT